MRRFPILFIALLLAVSVRADGDSRRATANEKAFFARFYGGVVGALPPGPEGWVEMNRTDTTPPDSLGVGSEDHPLRADYGCAWRNQELISACEQRTMEALMPLVTAAPDPRMSELMAVHNALAAELGAAIERNDLAALERIRDRSEENAAKIRAIQEEQDRERIRIERENAAKDAVFAVRVRVHSFSEEFYTDDVEPLAPVAGCPAWRIHGEGRFDEAAWSEGRTVVLMGRWTGKREGTARWFEAEPAAGRPSTAVQTIVVEVEGSPARCRAYLERIDWARLKALMR